MATYNDYVKQGKTPQQIADAIKAKYGEASPLYKKYGAGSKFLPRQEIAPVKTPEMSTLKTPEPKFTPRQEIASAKLPEMNTTVSGPDEGNFGQVAKGNVHANTFEDTGVAFSERAKESAAALAEIATAEGAKKKAIIEEKNVDKNARANARQAALDQIDKDFAGDMDNRRADAEKIFQRQDEIAARNANIASAKAGESGLVLSEGAMTDVNADIQAKYGQNILNAEQFKMETNKSIDQALKDTGLAIFDKKDGIDRFKDALKDAEFEPILNAVSEAAKGNKDAINDVASYYKEYLKKKADEEYVSFAASNTRDRKNKEWEAADPGQKISLLKAYGGDELTPYIDASIQKIGDYAGQSMDFVLAKIAKTAKDDGRGDQMMQTYLQMREKGSEKIPAMEALINQDLKKANRSAEISDMNVGQTNEKMADLDKKFVAQPEPNLGPTPTAPAKQTFGLSESNLAILSKVTPANKAAAIKKLMDQSAKETSAVKRKAIYDSIQYLKQ